MCLPQIFGGRNNTPPPPQPVATAPTHMPEAPTLLLFQKMKQKERQR